MLPRESPSHLRLTLLVVEGYVYLVGVVGVFLSAAGLLAWGIANRRPFLGLAALIVGVPLAVTTATAIRALFFRVPEPQGPSITAEAAPALHDMVEDVRRRVRSPRLDRILVGDTFNAAAGQLPRVGIFWPRNLLVIGYPLLATLSPEHLRAVVAHELGHLSRAHGRFAVWVYRIRLTWWRLFAALDERGSTPAHVPVLFHWYMQRLARCSSAIARAQETLADRCAAAVAGSAVAAETLVAVQAASEVERKVWEAVFARVEHEPEPPRPFAEMGPHLWDGLPADSRFVERLLDSRFIERLLDRSTADGDTHPSLRDRLSALGEPAAFPARPSRTAGDVYLASQMGVLAAALDARWQDEHREEWRRHHDTLRQRRDRVRELAALEQPSPADVFERAHLTEELDGADRALPLYREALARGHAAAGLALGRILLERDDETGLALVERAMEADRALVPEGCNHVMPYLARHGRMLEMHRFAQMATRHATHAAMAEQEHQQVSAIDRFVPHALPADRVGVLAAWLARQPGIVEAFVVGRELRYAAGRELVCAILARPADAHGMRERLQQESVLPAETRLVLLGRHDRPLRAALHAVPGSRVYLR